MLKIIEELPANFFNVSGRELHTLFDGPTLIHLKGKRERPLFITAMLHGNEESGLLVAQKLLSKYQDKELPRSLSLLIGNVRAAKENVRMLDDQLDFNRIWAGPASGEQERDEYLMAKQVLQEMRDKQIFACIDIHNNTGKNPYYSCINRINNQFINLASLFEKTIIYFEEPREVCAIAFARLCPAATIECGLSGEQRGVEQAFDFADSVLHLERISDRHIKAEDVNLYHTVAKVSVPKGASVCFGKWDGKSDFCFSANFDYFNFSQLDEGMTFGQRHNDKFELTVLDDFRNEIQEQYLVYEGTDIKLLRGVIPSMFTKDVEVIHQDCLGYLMEPLFFHSK